jgi:alpha-tubulin suppressor-like RCC1 family protein
LRRLIALLGPTILITSFISFSPAEALPVEQKVVIEETLSAGGDHSCAVTVAGLARCWGYSGYGQADVPSDLGQVTQVSAGESHSCAVTVAGLARCWGYNGYAQVDVPSDLGEVTQVSASKFDTCALTVAGVVRCWGFTGTRQVDVPSDLGVVTQVSAGGLHVCALTVRGVVRCWGWNGNFQSEVPADLGVVTQVSAGDSHSCAVNVFGVVRCWGEVGQPVPSDLGVVTQVSAGRQSSCALNNAGLVRCWGNIISGQNSVPSDLDIASQVSAGRSHSCALSVAGVVRCWGDIGGGKTEVPMDRGGVSLVSAGYYHSCALNDAGAVRCWGENRYGQADVPLDLDASVAVGAGFEYSCALSVAGVVRCWGIQRWDSKNAFSDFGVTTQISVGWEHLCALSVAGVVRCRGYNNFGQTDVPLDLGVVTQVDASGNHSCAVTVAGLARCWGQNNHGESDVPTNLGRVTQVSVGTYHACALSVAGLVRCWGINTEGELDVPLDLGVVTQVDASSHHSCAVTIAGLVRCWGFNRSGQAEVPLDLGVVTQVSAGFTHTCALAVAGLVRCWGDNYWGESGVPPDAYLSKPYLFKQTKVLEVGSIEGAIVGDPMSGSSVSVEFDLNEGQSLNYQWYRDGTPMADATQSTYKITEEDFGTQLAVAAVLRSDSKIHLGSASRYVGYPSLIFSQPTISGLNSLGSLLSAFVGNSDPQVSFSYQWLRNGQVIPNSTASQHRVRLVDLGQDLSVNVTGTKVRNTSSARTSSVTRISTTIPNSPCAGTIEITSSWLGTSSQPGITGVPAFGQTLKGYNGIWAAGTKFCTFWMSDGVVIPKNTTSNLKLDGTSVGKNLQFVVVGIDKTSKRVARVSEPLLVTKANFTNFKNPTVRGIAKVGVKLTSSLSSWGSGTSYGYQWLRNSEEISGATASSYVPTAADVGTNLSLRVCGTKPYFEQRCVESVSQVVSLGVISKVGLASVRGTATNIGVTIFGNTTQWMPGVELSWQWLADGIEIESANASTYTIARSDRGKTISLRITGYADGYQSVSKVAKYKKIP